MVSNQLLTSVKCADVMDMTYVAWRSSYRAPTLLKFGSITSLTLAGVGTVVEANPRTGRPQGACAGMGVATNTMRYPCS